MKAKQATCAALVLLLLFVSCTGVRAYEANDPIRINSNSDFVDFAGSGDGTAENPWIIQGMEINGTDYGYCIYVGNTTDYFVIQYNCLYGACIPCPDDTYAPNACIAFYNVQNGTVAHNEISQGYYHGIYLYMSAWNLIQGNNVSDNECGIYLIEDSHNNEISYNYVLHNSYAGIGTDYSDYNEIGYNTADYNFMGIFINDAAHCCIQQNLAFYNDYGVYVEDSLYNLFVNNSLCLSDGCGVYVDDHSYHNGIYHNNFGNNACQACDDGISNDWDSGYPGGGNFWTDYNGMDEYSGPDQNEPGSDGIGDTPYAGIEGWGVDLYPLMEWVETYGLGRRDDPNGLGRRDDPN